MTVSATAPGSADFISPEEATRTLAEVDELIARTQAALDEGTHMNSRIRRDLKNQLEELQGLRNELVAAQQGNPVNRDHVQMDEILDSAQSGAEYLPEVEVEWHTSRADYFGAQAEQFDARGDLDEARGTSLESYTYDVGDSEDGSTARVSARWVREHAADPDALYDAFTNQPERFAEAWSDLDADQRGLIMFSLQEQVSLNNQITEMLTSLLKAAHDTTSAIARNLVV